LSIPSQPCRRERVEWREFIEDALDVLSKS
jgi:hypothetical protein